MKLDCSVSDAQSIYPPAELHINNNCAFFAEHWTLFVYFSCYYLWQGGYVFGSVGLSVCLFVCLSAILL